MHKLLLITHFINGFLLVRFSISKLLAWPISVNAFIEMSKPIGIDPTFFRLSTGVLISTVCIFYFLSFFLLLTNKMSNTNQKTKTILLANLLGIGAMSGALISEFFLRISPKWPLVIIASMIILFSILNIILLKKSYKFE